jgi:hypothetical protein
MDDNRMNQIAKVLRMDSDGELLKVQALEDKAEFRVGGSMHGYRYEWGINHYSFLEKESCKAAFGLTDADWDHWNALYVERFDPVKDEWYTDEAIKSFRTLSE